MADEVSGGATDEVVRYEVDGPVATVTMNRPEYRNAQNSAMTYALDAAFTRAVDDDEVKVIVLAGAGEHFSAGHDIGTPGRDVDESFERKAVLWWDHVDKPGGDQRYAREIGGLPRACAGAGGRSRSRRSRWCRARASRAG